MNKKYLFSIITVVYNDSENLEKTIISILKQKFENFQYIIIDGGSTDETKEIISKYSKYVDNIISENDNGIYDAMNKGLNLSDGYWINFLNAGDEYLESTFLHDLSIQASNNSFNLLYTDFVINNIIYSPVINLFYLLRSMPCHQSIFYKYDLFDSKLYNLEYKYCADFNHLIEKYQIIKSLKIINLKIKYLGGGFSAKKNSQKSILNERFKIIYKSNLDFNFKIIFFAINRLQYFKHLLCSFL